MEKVKQEVFSNFNYGIIKSIDNRCVDVKCTYNYKGKTLTHYFSYAKQGNKPTSYYIDKAKADMNKLIKEKKAESVAKKDLNGSKATFFKRHKKPILIATTAVLVAGIATAATLIALKYTANDPTAVTEAEIDKYLEGPTGNTTHLNPLFVDKILTEAEKNIADKNLKGFETKMLTSMPVVNLIDEFLSKSPMVENGLSAVMDPAEMLNDTSEFYVNNQFKNKNFYGSYLKGSLLQDQKQTYASTMHTFDNYTGLKNGSNVSSKSEALTVFKHTANPSSSDLNPFITFGNRKYIYNGYSGPNMETSRKIGSFETEVKSSDAIFEDFTDAAITLCAAKDTDVLRRHMDKYRVTEDGSTVFLKYEEDITSEITDNFPLRRLMGIPVKYHAEAVWYFKNVDKLGWVLDSFASDGLIYNIYGNPIVNLYDGTSYLIAPAYVEYNERGEKLSKPVCINKDKGFTKLSYGDLDTDKSIDDVTYTHDTSIKAPATANALYLESKESDPYPPFPAGDITMVRRIDNPKFNGYSLLGTVAPDPQCLEGSSVLFNYIPESESGETNPIFLDYAALKDYLNQDIFEEGEKITSGKEYTLIKLKKAGWFTYEIVLDDKLQLSNMVIDFHEGPSPIIK